jgi:hypothetical protein
MEDGKDFDVLCNAINNDEGKRWHDDFARSGNYACAARQREITQVLGSLPNFSDDGHRRLWTVLIDVCACEAGHDWRRPNIEFSIGKFVKESCSLTFSEEFYESCQSAAHFGGLRFGKAETGSVLLDNRQHHFADLFLALLW